MKPRTRAALPILGAFVLAALGWVAAGLIVRVAGLGELDLPVRAGGVMLALSLGERVLVRLAPAAETHS